MHCSYLALLKAQCSVDLGIEAPYIDLLKSTSTCMRNEVTISWKSKLSLQALKNGGGGGGAPHVRGRP